MKRERVFSKNGGYELCLHTNALMHHEATELGIKILEKTLVNYDSSSINSLSNRHDSNTLHVLDLACGGMPVTLADILAHFPEQQFSYTGIDINHDQTENLRNRFEFSDNVTSVKTITGTAWDLSDDKVKPYLRDQYDIIFSGFNLHHGTPEELYFLAQQLHEFLNPCGVFFNVDEYRPNEANYVRRPDQSLDGLGESYLMIDPEKIAANLYSSNIVEANFEETPQWKKHLLKLFRTALLEGGGEPTIVDSLIEHVRKRDYPVSIIEASQIFKEVGFDTNADYHNKHYPNIPLAQYFAMLVATKPIIK